RVAGGLRGVAAAALDAARGARGVRGLVDRPGGEHQLPHDQRGEQHPPQHPDELDGRLAALFAEDALHRCRSGRGSSSTDVSALVVMWIGARNAGISTGTLRLTFTVTSVGLVISAPGRQPFGRSCFAALRYGGLSP